MPFSEITENKISTKFKKNIKKNRLDSRKYKNYENSNKKGSTIEKRVKNVLNLNILLSSKYS